MMGGGKGKEDERSSSAMQAAQQLPKPSHPSHNLLHPPIQGIREEKNRTVDRGSLFWAMFSVAAPVAAATLPQVETSAANIPDGNRFIQACHVQVHSS